MTNRTTRRIDALEKQAREAGAFDVKLDVTKYFAMVRDAYGIDGDIEPVIMRARDWERLSETILQLYG